MLLLVSIIALLAAMSRVGSHSTYTIEWHIHLHGSWFYATLACNFFTIFGFVLDSLVGGV
ncbi:hypothetical protein DFS33DRAFT_1364988 [Desarmillaria ectypa]|nr:hypothetical protein DFS33DRAFT_1364988 [Desarmillaria ectypa]